MSINRVTTRNKIKKDAEILREKTRDAKVSLKSNSTYISYYDAMSSKDEKEPIYFTSNGYSYSWGNTMESYSLINVQNVREKIIKKETYEGSLYYGYNIPLSNKLKRKRSLS